MDLKNIFRRKGYLEGGVIIRGFPAHKTYIVSVTTFRVPHASSPRPFDGKPPASEYREQVWVKDKNDPEDKPLRFHIGRSAGFYYLDVGVIAFIECGGKMYAQLEHFMPMTKACRITSGEVYQVDLVVDWPMMPVDELGSYGVMHPKTK